MDEVALKRSWTLTGLLRHLRRNAGAYLRSRLGYRYQILRPLRGNSSWGVRGIDHVLAEIINVEKGFYCELGAYDGVHQSNTLFLELYRGWRGILIEPVNENFKLLVKNRSSRRNRLVRAASVGFNFVEKEMPIAVGGLMSTPVAGRSDIKEPIANARIGRQNQKRFAGETVEPPIEMCPALTLTQIFDQNECSKRVDLLSLDVEGAELEVLSGIDWDRYQIEWILVESRTPETTAEYLTSRGYLLFRTLTPIDFLFRRVASGI